uniref:Uncharacterized protein n=1 Tax=Opuntia streptacantha TaxID=393608 RepID=A0A7C9CVS3_OPUST
MMTISTRMLLRSFKLSWSRTMKLVLLSGTKSYPMLYLGLLGRRFRQKNLKLIKMKRRTMRRKMVKMRTRMMKRMTRMRRKRRMKKRKKMTSRAAERRDRRGAR